VTKNELPRWFGGPQGSPRSDKLIAVSIQWAEIIMAKIEGPFAAQ
jgi:hypothetical protein